MISGVLGAGFLATVVVMMCMVNARGEDLPPAPKVQTSDTSDDYFGTKVADPYRLLEDESRPETQAFVQANNARTRAFLDGAERERLKARLTELIDFPRQSVPERWGTNAFYSTNSGLQNQAILRVASGGRSDAGDGRVLIDPNALSPDGSLSIGNTDPSFDGSLLAYGLMRSGSDHSEVRVMDVISGKDRAADVIPPARIWSVVWRHDNGGFYYGKFPKTAEHGKDEQAYGFQMFFHPLGSPAENDELIYARPDDKELAFEIDISDDGKFETMTLNRGTKSENRLYWRRAGELKGEWNKLIDNEDFVYQPIDTDGGSKLYVLTSENAPRRKVIAIDLDKPAKENWKTILEPQGGDVIDDVHRVGDKLVVVFLRDAQSVLKLFNLDGTLDRAVELPTVGAVDQISGRPEHQDFYYTFSSYSYPTTIFRYDLKTHTSTVHFAPKVKFTPGDYETKQLFAKSKDGTRVPVFVTCRKGTKLDGTNPTVLSGYGGFNISIKPYFNSLEVAWLERGGVFAEAILRGGGEYGESWHQDGMLGKKQHVFDDFQAVAEMLIAQKYTSNKKLAIEGGSNGGLLVAACMLQRPDLYGAVLCHVPVADMLRYQKLGIGRFWTVEYGNAEESAEQFRWLYAYSPLHNVRAGQVYPPILIMTGAGDNRVVPGHSFKFVATLQAKASETGNPVLLWTEPQAGHGHGKPTSTVINQNADADAFLVKVLGMKDEGSR